MDVLCCFSVKELTFCYFSGERLVLPLKVVDAELENTRETMHTAVCQFMTVAFPLFMVVIMLFMYRFKGYICNVHPRIIQ